jgi:acetyl-CoA synthetase
LQGAFQEARDFLVATREDYHAACAEFRWPSLQRFNWALEWFDEIASGPRADQTALWVVEEDGSETKLTFRQLSERSSRIANYFRGLGLKRGECLLLMMGNVPPLWETLLAAMKLGAVVTPTTTLLTADELADRGSRGGVRFIVAAAEHTGKFENVNPDCVRVVVGNAAGNVPGNAPRIDTSRWHRYEDGYSSSSIFKPGGETNSSDPLLLFFTSGTTAKPKLVMHSHISYPVGHLSTMYWLGLRPGDIHFNLSSPGWAKHSWSCFFAPWNAEATVFVLNQRRFNAQGLLDALVRCGVNSFCAPPTVWRLLITENLDRWRVKLREVVSAGEPLNPEVIDRVRAAWGVTIRDGYGQTETTAMIGNSPGQPLKVGSMGKPLPGYRIVLLDPAGNEASEGEVSIKLDPRPVGLTPGYFTESGTTVGSDAHFYRTGDVAFRDADGYFTFVGRADDVFKSSDYRISPFELESALIKHPDVVECAVVPSPDPIRLCVPKAFVALRAGVDPTREIALSIFQHARKVLSPYKRVRRIEFVDLPKTVSGKIRRVELRRSEEKKANAAPRHSAEYREEEFPELKQTSGTGES